MVSRFEAASERPDRATHRRYCALAPTEELRQQLTSAYEALPPLNGDQRRPALVRRSPEEWHGRALDGPGVYQLLREVPGVPGGPAVRRRGQAAAGLAELAPAEQWQDVEAPLGRLDLSKPVPDVRTWRYWEPCDPRGEEEFKRHLDEWDRQLREAHAGHSSTSRPGTSSPTTSRR